MTSEVIGFTIPLAYPSGMHPLTALRRQRRVSQLELGLRAGVSQRHLSCIETGRSRPTRSTLLALLDALDATLPDRNAALLAAGLAPAPTSGMSSMSSSAMSESMSIAFVLPPLSAAIGLEYVWPVGGGAAAAASGM